MRSGYSLRSPYMYRSPHYILSSLLYVIICINPSLSPVLYVYVMFYIRVRILKIYSAVMLDIDGTLLDTRNQVSPNTKKLLNRLEKRGIPVVLSSARAPSEIEVIVRLVDLHSPIVCYGGSLILDEDRAIIEDTGIDIPTAVAFKAFAEREFPDVSISSYIYDTWVTDDESNPYIRRLEVINQREPVEGSLESAVRMSSHVHKFLCSGEPQTVRKLQQTAAPQFPSLEFMSSGAVYLEVVSNRVSKRTAMEIIRQYYQISMEQMVAIGDYFVDMEMIRYAGLGIAMGNAPEAVKQAAARVTASNDEEGVYIALKNLRFQPPERIPEVPEIM